MAALPVVVSKKRFVEAADENRGTSKKKEPEQ